MSEYYKPVVIERTTLKIHELTIVTLGALRNWNLPISKVFGTRQNSVETFNIFDADNLKPGEVYKNLVITVNSPFLHTPTEQLTSQDKLERDQFILFLDHLSECHILNLIILTSSPINLIKVNSPTIFTSLLDLNAQLFNLSNISSSELKDSIKRNAHNTFRIGIFNDYPFDEQSNHYSSTIAVVDILKLYLETKQLLLSIPGFIEWKPSDFALILLRSKLKLVLMTPLKLNASEITISTMGGWISILDENDLRFLDTAIKLLKESN